MLPALRSLLRARNACVRPRQGTARALLLAGLALTLVPQEAAFAAQPAEAAKPAPPTAQADAPVPFSSTAYVTFNPEPPNLGSYTVDSALWPDDGTGGTFSDVPHAGPQYFHPGNGIPSLVDRIYTDARGHQFSIYSHTITDAVWVDEAGLHVHQSGAWQLLGGDSEYADLRGSGAVDAVILFSWHEGIGWRPATGVAVLTGKVSTNRSNN